MWAKEVEKAPHDRRDHIKASFANSYISKFDHVYGILWKNKKRLVKYPHFDILGRLAQDLARLHAA